MSTALPLAAILALILVPGIGAVLWLFPPGRLALPTRLALAFGLGYAVTGGSAYLLTVAGVLSPATFLALVGAASAVVWWRAARTGLRAHARAIRDEVRRNPWGVVIGLGVVAAIALIWSGYLSAFRTVSPYRYWVDGIELADAGGIPDRTLHYGRLFPPVTSKIVLNAFTAGADYVTGPELAPAINAMLWITAVGTAAALWAVGHELGLRLLAPLLPLLLIANRVILGTDMSYDLASYRGEIVGRMVAFSALALAIAVLRRPRRLRDGVLAGLVFAAAAGTHLVPTLICALLLAWYGAAVFLRSAHRRDVLRRGAVIAGVTALASAAVLLLPRGEIGFEGAGRPETYTRVRFDKTLYLYNGIMSPEGLRESERFYLTPSTVVHSFVGRGLGIASRSPLHDAGWTVAMALAGVAGAVVLWRWGPKRIGPLAAAAVGMASSMIAAALFFSFRYDLFIPATFGERRLFDYAPLPIVLWGLALGEAGFRALRRVRRFGVRAPVVAAALVVVVATGWLAPSARVGRTSLEEGRRAVAILDWVRRRTPCNARILTNQRTVGVIRATTGRVGVLEGMGPFLRPRMLDEIVDLLLRTRAFYGNPARGARFLEREGVDYVIVLTGLRLGHQREIGPVDPEPFADVPFLRRVHATPFAEVFRVTGIERANTFPDPADQPGYRCRRDPLRA